MIDKYTNGASVLSLQAINISGGIIPKIDSDIKNTVSITMAEHMFGSEVFIITANDGVGIDNNGVEDWEFSFTLNVESVNDPPVFSIEDEDVDLWSQHGHCSRNPGRGRAEKALLMPWIAAPASIGAKEAGG